MQTFLPYPDFVASAKCLDRQRLGKQRVEAKQILNTLLHGGGWKHHPAVKMWKGYEAALAEYGFVICSEWINRGYRDSLLLFFHSKRSQFTLPFWLGYEEFHASHRSNLLRKDLEYYSQFHWKEGPGLPYLWPV